MHNIENKRVVRYISWTNTIKLPQKIGSNVIADFVSAIKEWEKRRPYDVLTLDFQSVMKPYSNGMLPLIATITDMRLRGYKVKIVLPNDNNVRKLFRSTNWAYYLSPQEHPKSESIHDRHLVTKQFVDYKELAGITNDFMDVILRSMPIPKDIFSALEWSINEICDNVINHSQSKIGGFIEIITFPKNEQIAFTVADVGKGILNTLKEGIPTLRTDLQAIGEAIKAGVTRNKEFGQGNGLAGSLRITTMSNGSLDITSGTGRFYSTATDNHKFEGVQNQYYNGTSVSGVIRMNKSFSIIKALDFGGPIPYTPVNIIDLNYEMEDQDCLLIIMKNETTGFGTRSAGRQLKIKTINLITSKPNYPIFVDWSGIPVISSSFADEYMGKLFLELGPLNFSALIRNNNMELLVRQLLDKAIFQRLTQEKD